MPILKQTPFTAYEFTEEELAVASVLSPMNYQYVQTLMADAVAEKIVLQYDPQMPISVVQREAYLRGQIDFANFLLGLSDDRKKSYMELIEAKQAQQQYDQQQ